MNEWNIREKSCDFPIRLVVFSMRDDKANINHSGQKQQSGSAVFLHKNLNIIQILDPNLQLFPAPVPPL